MDELCVWEVSRKAIGERLLITKNNLGANLAFARTPDFASPEQFGGVQVGIRSDLYSLGATLWNTALKTDSSRSQKI
jgi:hypothetical protein